LLLCEATVALAAAAAGVLAGIDDMLVNPDVLVVCSCLDTAGGGGGGGAGRLTSTIEGGFDTVGGAGLEWVCDGEGGCDLVAS